MAARLALDMDATLDEVRRLETELAAFGEQQHWPPDLAYQVQLVVEELCVNIVNYGGDGSHRIELVLESTPDALAIDIIDDGIAFDPFAEAPPPDLDSEVEDRPIGGLGVHFVKTLMDETKYRREDGRNHITLRKRRAEAPNA